jgi:prepilin-type N-terminal cleavage/methylation domain-containing protein
MKKAFTLVELAIVIVIIGLLVGGVLAGQELIKQAKIRAYIKKLTQVDAAIHTFYAKYNFIPGDMPSIQSQKFFGILGGNGDGQLCSHAICANGLTGSSDSQYSWLHLHASGIMPLQLPNGDPFVLSSPGSSGITRYYARFREDRGGGNSYDIFGVMMLHTGDFARVYHGLSEPYGVDNKSNNITITNVMQTGTQTYGAFTPEEARVMDEKLDDGNAVTGKLLGPWGAYVAVSSPCHTNGVYSNNDKNMLCRILYNFGL